MNVERFQELEILDCVYIAAANTESGLSEYRAKQAGKRELKARFVQSMHRRVGPWFDRLWDRAKESDMIDLFGIEQHPEPFNPEEPAAWCHWNVYNAENGRNIIGAETLLQAFFAAETALRENQAKLVLVEKRGGSVLDTATAHLGDNETVVWTYHETLGHRLREERRAKEARQAARAER